MPNARKLAASALLAATLATGAAAQVTTLLLEIDYMEDALHSHAPSSQEIAALVRMFACQGITLVVDVDDALPHRAVTSCANPGSTGEAFFTCTSSTASFANIAQFDNGPGWHYCIFGHFYDDGNGITSSGIAELPGVYLFVADGVVGAQPFWRASTLAHELGHNLGLEHHAPSSTGTPGPFAPNLPSVMSYRYQLGGVRTQLECQGLVGSAHRFKDLDYSSGRLPLLNESSLNESLGMWMVPVDWACDGPGPGFASRDLDAGGDWCAAGPGTGTLRDRDEWAAIVDVADQGPAPGGERPYVACEPFAELAEQACPSPPALSIEPCAQGQAVFVRPLTASPLQLGTGTFPFRYLDDALSASVPGSVLFLQPGNQELRAGGGLVVSTPTVLAGPGAAVIDP